MQLPRSLNHIRMFRRRYRLSQAELSRLAGVSQTRISAWESGRETPKLENAIEVALALGQPLEAVFEPMHTQAAERVARRRD